MPRAKGQLTALQKLGNQSLKEAYPLNILTRDDAILILEYFEIWQMNTDSDGDNYPKLSIRKDGAIPPMSYGESNYSRIRYKLENCLNAKAISI